MTVVQFKKPFRQTEQEPPRGEHRFTVYIYEDDNDTSTNRFDAIVQQPNADDVDMDAFITAVRSVENVATIDRFDATKDPSHDWLMTVRVYRSSLVETKTLVEEFESQAQKEWLRRRLEDAYLQVDDRFHGLGWFIHSVLNRIDRAIARIRRSK